MFGGIVVVTSSTEISTLAVDDLKGDTTNPGGDNGDAGVEDLAFTSIPSRVES